MPGHVLLFSESSEPGGAETVVLELATGLLEAGWPVQVVLMKRGWLFDAFVERSITPHYLPSDRAFDLQFPLRLARLSRRLNTQLIHSHLPDSNAYACIAGAVTRVPVVATYHALSDALRPVSRSERVRRWIVKTLARKVVAVSADMQRELVNRHHFPQNKVEVVYNGVDWRRFDTPLNREQKRLDLGIPPQATVVGMVGVVRQVKGHAIAIHALARLRASLPNLLLLVAGHEHAEYKRELQDLARQQGVGDQVIFLGFRSDVAEVIRCMDVCVMPSWSEGHPLATIEAMGSRVPVVASDVGGHPEIIKDGVTGYLVPAGNDELLAKRVQTLLAEPAEAHMLAERAAQSVRERFSHSRMLSAHEDLYRQCLGG